MAQATFVKATPAMDMMARSLMRVNSFLAKWQQKVDAAMNTIKDEIEANGVEGIQGLSWKATLKTDKDGEKTDWETVARNMAIQFGTAGQAALATEKAANTTTRKGATKFRFTPIGSSSTAVNSGK